MKKNAFLTALVLSSGSSFAGETTTPVAAQISADQIPCSSSCSSCLKNSNLFLSGGVDFLGIDGEDTQFFTGRVGYTFGGTDEYSQALFLEVGWLDHDDSDGLLFDDTYAIPVTANYEYRRALFSCLNLYLGGGAGVAYVNSDTVNQVGVQVESDNEFALYAQAFAGLTVCLTENIEAYWGVRYIWTDDFGVTSGLNEWSVGGGLRYIF